jgi:hypothetical protein
MMQAQYRARLLNADGELIAEGPCWLNEAQGQATLEPERTPGVLQRQRGHLSLELDSGRSLVVSDKTMIVRIAPPGRDVPEEAKRKLFRLRLVDLMDGLGDAPAAPASSSTREQRDPDTTAQDAPAFNSAGAPAARTSRTPEGRGPETTAQDASAAGGAEEGRSAASVQGRLRENGETPAAR